MLTTPLDQFIKRGLEYCEKASPGKWVRVGVSLDQLEIATYGCGPNGMYHVATVNRRNEEYCSHDANLIAAARTDLPLALKMLERAVEALEKIEMARRAFMNANTMSDYILSIKAEDLSRETLAELSAMAEGAGK